ncbi:hypothetical protein BHM03_00021354 [Ensete ventricosum]|nr:hypothetical protein BHM03_00021354 [Ensete ventricosum]
MSFVSNELGDALLFSGSVYTGVEFCKRLCGISIIRSLSIFQLIYHNLPKDIADRNVLLLDPILGTGWFV